MKTEFQKIEPQALINKVLLNALSSNPTRTQDVRLMLHAIETKYVSGITLMGSTVSVNLSAGIENKPGLEELIERLATGHQSELITNVRGESVLLINLLKQLK